MTTLQIVRDVERPKARRGTSNGNARGSNEDRRRRREWLVETYRADVTGIRVRYADVPVRFLATSLIGTSETCWPRPEKFNQVWAHKHEVQRVHGYITTIDTVPACRCYRCGRLLTVDTVTVDRIIPGCKGGTYRRNNIRPACGDCNSETGGALASHPKKRGRR